MKYSLSRFKNAHETDYPKALAEIKDGRKASHWMWYIFPQLKGLGKSPTSEYYGLHDLDEAKDFLRDEDLGAHLLEISNALLQLDCTDATAVLGRPDDMKLKSCMTLFSQAAPEERVFTGVLEKYFKGKPDYRTLKLLGIHEETDPAVNAEKPDRIIRKEDNNIRELRAKHPEGLHFVVGDTHGQYQTLQCLMAKIEFDPSKDHVYFVGDYNDGGNPTELLRYIARYYREDLGDHGFHLIRGNHERELGPIHALENLPDVFVLKHKHMTYYLTHAGMVRDAFDLINEDIKDLPEGQGRAYALDNSVTNFNAPFRQLTWSRRGLYSQRSRYHVWPSEESLHAAKACIIHGHTPFSMLKNGNYYSYGDKMLLWEQQRIWFAEDLQSFDIDSNAKGRFETDDHYRGLSCVCLEVLDEIAAKNNSHLTRDAIRESENFVFAVPYAPNAMSDIDADLSIVLEAKPEMKRIALAQNGEPRIVG